MRNKKSGIEKKTRIKGKYIIQALDEYEKEGKRYKLKSWMDLEGTDSKRTAMAKTVGLPLAIAAELLAEGKIKTYGVILPTLKEVYEPMLAALEKEGISFKEEIIEI